MNSTVTKKTWKKRKFNKKAAIILAAVLVVGTTFGVRTYKNKQKAKIPFVSLAKLEKKTLTQSISVTGIVEPINKSEIGLNPGQKVKEVLVKEGQGIKKGEVLVKYDIEDYEYQLKKAQLNYQITNDNINKTLSAAQRNDKTTLESAVKAAEMAVETANSSLDDANKKLKQNEELLKGGYIAQNEYDTSKKTALDLQSQLKSAELKLSDAKNALANFDANTQDKVNDLSKQNETAKLDIDSFNNKIKSCTITSNIDGTIAKCDAKAEDNPKAGDSIIIHDTSAYRLSVDVSQYDVVNFKKGQKADIKIKGIDKKYTGTICEVASFAQKTTATSGQQYKINVKINIDNPDENIKVGYEGDADIIINQKENALALNFDSIKQNGKDKFVLVVQNGIAQKKPVKTGLETEMYTEIVEGLNEGQEIIVNPPKNLKAGDKVTVGTGVKKK